MSKMMDSKKLKTLSPTIPAQEPELSPFQIIIRKFLENNHNPNAKCLRIAINNLVRRLIFSRLDFQPNDIKWFRENCGYNSACELRRFETVGMVETWYNCAISVRNYSAARSIEKALSRPPFIYIDVYGGWDYKSNRTHERLAVGSRFTWHEGNRELRLEVTSFGTKKTIKGDIPCIIACAYEEEIVTNRFGRTKCTRNIITRRLHITLKELRAATRILKKQQIQQRTT